MIKDFGKFINEGYTHKFEDNFISEFDSRSLDINYDRAKYEDIDSSNLKLEWIIEMSIQNDGIYSFDFSGIKAVLTVNYMLKLENDESPEIFEEIVYEINSENIQFEKADKFTQLIIDEVEVDFKNGETYLTAKMMENFN